MKHLMHRAALLVIVLISSAACSAKTNNATSADVQASAAATPDVATTVAADAESAGTATPDSAPSSAAASMSPEFQSQMASTIQDMDRKEAAADAAPTPVAFTDASSAALADAAAAGDTARVADLVKGGANPSALGDQQMSILQYTVDRSTTGFEALLDAGADPATTDADGDTVIFRAIVSSDPAYLASLLAHHANPNFVNAKNGLTPLMEAARTGGLAQIRALLAAGADPNLGKDSVGNTALTFATADSGQMALVLLRAGADPSVKIGQRNATFQTYLRMSVCNGITAEARQARSDVASWLTQHNVPVEDGLVCQ